MSTRQTKAVSAARRSYGVRNGTRQAQALATRRRLIETGRKLFAENGYYATGTTEIVAQSGLTLGALYHHFADKEDFFLAVFMDVQRDVPMISLEPAEQASESNPWSGFRKAVNRFLHAIADHKDLQRILLLDGPAVLGWRRWREIQQSYGLATISDVVASGIAAGILPALPVTQLAHMILAVIDEAAILIVNEEPRPSAIKRVAKTVDAVLGGLAIPQPKS